MLEAYENKNGDFRTNGEATVIGRLATLPIHTVFDVGANIGEYSKLLTSRIPNVRIHAFEIEPTTSEELRQNVAELPGVIVNNFGLSNRPGEVPLKNFDDDSRLSSLFDYPHEGQSRWVSCRVTTGDIYCRENAIDKIDFLKMDVEGAEHLVLAGFADMLSHGKIDVIQFEYGYVNVLSKFLLHDFAELLTGYGYKLGKIYPRKVEFKEYELKDENFWGPNYIAVRNDRPDIIRLLSGTD